MTDRISFEQPRECRCHVTNYTQVEGMLVIEAAVEKGISVSVEKMVTTPKLRGETRRCRQSEQSL